MFTLNPHLSTYDDDDDESKRRDKIDDDGSGGGGGDEEDEENSDDKETSTRIQAGYHVQPRRLPCVRTNGPLAYITPFLVWLTSGFSPAPGRMYVRPTCIGASSRTLARSTRREPGVRARADGSTRVERRMSQVAALALQV